MDDDTSKAAKVCEDWGEENGRRENVGKWSWSEEKEDRLYNHLFVVWHNYHWLIEPGLRVECDDLRGGVSAGDFWKIYVR